MHGVQIALSIPAGHLLSEWMRERRVGALFRAWPPPVSVVLQRLLIEVAPERVKY
jgi:hypothetical protein